MRDITPTMHEMILNKSGAEQRKQCDESLVASAVAVALRGEKFFKFQRLCPCFVMLAVMEKTK